MRKVLFLLGVVALLSGCAHYETWALDPATGQLILVGKGDSYGFLRDQVTTRSYDKDTGRLVQETVASTSTTASLLGTLNQIMGTLFEAGKGMVKP